MNSLLRFQKTVFPINHMKKTPFLRRFFIFVIFLFSAALIAGVYFAVEKRVCPFFGLRDAVRKKHWQPLMKKCAAVLQRRRKKEDDEDAKTP